MNIKQAHAWSNMKANLINIQTFCFYVYMYMALGKISEFKFTKFVRTPSVHYNIIYIQTC